MDLSLDEAAVLLGKTARQVRYLVQTGRLQAKKDGARWVFRKEDLPLGPGAAGARERAVSPLRNVAEDVLPPAAAMGVAQLRAGWARVGPGEAPSPRLARPSNPEHAVQPTVSRQAHCRSSLTSQQAGGRRASSPFPLAPITARN
jgi:excisionase family DNA binding protein